MPVPRSRAAPSVAPLTFDWWTPALASLSPLALDQTPAFGAVAEQAHEATLATFRHWRALTELQVSTVNEAYRLASSHAESRRQALTQLMETQWPASSAAEP